jgi:outer membrane murein-binding lipoprotein Lpp
MMPSKKGSTPTVAYVAKCSKCTKKHGPPLHEACLALLAADPEKSDVLNPDERDSDENLIDDPVGNDDLLLGTGSGGQTGQAGNHAVAQGINQDTVSGSPSGQASSNAVIRGTTSGGPGGQAGSNVVSQRDDAVATQLASMASAISTLASRYEATQSEVGALRAEVAASRTIARAPADSQPISASVSVPTHISSISSLRGDPVLAAQADQLVADLGTHTSGNSPSLSNVKWGLVRSVGDLEPLVKTPWPQDHIVGSGSKLKVYYENVSIYEWCNGYMAIIQNELNPIIARLMMSHFRTLMEDAVSHGWEAVKQAHKDTLIRLEMGEFTWYDELWQRNDDRH